MDKIEPFIAYLLHQKRYSSNTIIAYQKDIEQLFDFASKLTKFLHQKKSLQTLYVLG
jgi:site-specific recombinase XerD